MTPVPSPTALAPIIPDDMLYELVDGQVVEKTMSARETEIASILVGLLTPYLRTNRLGKVVGEIFHTPANPGGRRWPGAGWRRPPTWLSTPCRGLVRG